MLLLPHLRSPQPPSRQLQPKHQKRLTPSHLHHLIIKAISTAYILFSITQISANAIEILTDLTTQVTNTSNLFQSIEISNTYLDKELIIIADISTFDTKSILLLATPPNQTELPHQLLSITTINLSSFQSDSIYVDREAYESFSPIQLIRRASLKANHIGKWTIGIYNTQSKPSNPIRLRVLFLDSNETFCESLCNTHTANASTCTTKGRSSICTCGENFFGETCNIETGTNPALNIAFKVTAPPFEWVAFAIDVSKYSTNDDFSLLLSGLIESVVLSYVFDGISTPSFLENSQAINQQPLQGSTSSQSFQQYDIALDKIQETFVTSKKIIIAFFSQNKEADIEFNCKLQVIPTDSSTQTSDLTSQDYLIITGIVFASVVVLCIIPITIIVLRSRKRNRLRKEAMVVLMRQMSAARLQHPQNPDQQQNQMQLQQHQQLPPLNMDDILINLNSPIASASNPFKKKDANSISLCTLEEFMPSKTREDLIRLYPSLLSEENTDCIVCLEPFAGDINCRVTPCFHVFHSQCLASWFEKHNNCPYCRAECNRKAITGKIHANQTTSYLKRMTAAISSSLSQDNDKKKSLKQDMQDIQLNNQHSQQQHQQQKQQQQQPQHQKLPQQQKNKTLKITRDNLEDSESNVNQQRISFADIGSKTSLKLTTTLASRHAHYFGQDTTVAAVGQGNNNINEVNSPSLDPMRLNAIPLQDQENPASSPCAVTSSLMKQKISDATNIPPSLNASEIFLERDPISYQSPVLKHFHIHSNPPPTLALNDELISLAVAPPPDQNNAPPTITTHRRNIQTELQSAQLNEPALSEIPFSSDRKWILNSETELASPIPLKTHLRYDSITTEIMISSAGLKDRDNEEEVDDDDDDDDRPRDRTQSLKDNLDPMQLQALFPEFPN